MVVPRYQSCLHGATRDGKKGQRRDEQLPSRKKYVPAAHPRIGMSRGIPRPFLFRLDVTQKNNTTPSPPQGRLTCHAASHDTSEGVRAYTSSVALKLGGMLYK